LQNLEEPPAFADQLLLLLTNQKTMSVFNTNAAYAVISSELARIAAEAWVAVQHNANAAAFARIMDTVSAMSGAERATAAGMAGAVSALLLSNLTGRRVPTFVHLVLRTMAAQGIVPGIAVTFPVTTGCFVGSWAFIGLHALRQGVLPWTLDLFLRAGLVTMELRGLHPLLLMDVVQLEATALQHFVAMSPFFTAVAVLVSGWLSAKVAGCITRAIKAAASLAGKAGRSVASCFVALIVAVFWSAPEAAVRFLVWLLRWAARAAERQEDFLFEDEDFEEVEEDAVPDAVASAAVVELEEVAVPDVVASEPAVVPEAVAAVSFLEQAKESLAVLASQAAAVASSIEEFVLSLQTDVVPFHALIEEGMAALVVMAAASARYMSTLPAEEVPLADFDFLLIPAAVAPAVVAVAVAPRREAAPRGRAARAVAAPAVAVAPRGRGRAARGGAVARRRAPAADTVVHATDRFAFAARVNALWRAHNLQHALPVPTRRSARLAARRT
jgi:hypothetical protein